MLHKLFDQDRIPQVPIYVDSPMAVNATGVFRNHPECLDREAHRVFLDEGDDPFGFARLNICSFNVDGSKALNAETETSMIVISASGMAEGGTILHHQKNNIGNPKDLVFRWICGRTYFGKKN